MSSLTLKTFAFAICIKLCISQPVSFYQQEINTPFLMRSEYNGNCYLAIGNSVSAGSTGHSLANGEINVFFDCEAGGHYWTYQYGPTTNPYCPDCQGWFIYPDSYGAFAQLQWDYDINDGFRINDNEFNIKIDSLSYATSPNEFKFDSTLSTFWMYNDRDYTPGRWCKLQHKTGTMDRYNKWLTSSTTTQVYGYEAWMDCAIAVAPQNIEILFTYPEPTDDPTPSPTIYPTPTPTNNPSPAPTANPTKSPTNNPLPAPTTNPTKSPTNNPTPTPTSNPISSPTVNPSVLPTNHPILTPTVQPTMIPTTKPRLISTTEIFSCIDENSAIVSISFDYSLPTGFTDTVATDIILNATKTLIEKHKTGLKDNCIVSKYSVTDITITSNSNHADIDINLCTTCNKQTLQELITDNLSQIDDNNNVLNVHPDTTTITVDIIKERAIDGQISETTKNMDVTDETDIKSDNIDSFGLIMGILSILICICIISICIYIVRKVHTDKMNQKQHNIDTGMQLNIVNNPGIKFDAANSTPIVVKNNSSIEGTGVNHTIPMKTDVINSNNDVFGEDMDEDTGTGSSIYDKGSHISSNLKVIPAGIPPLIGIDDDIIIIDEKEDDSPGKDVDDDTPGNTESNDNTGSDERITGESDEEFDDDKGRERGFTDNGDIGGRNRGYTDNGDVENVAKIDHKKDTDLVKEWLIKSVGFIEYYDILIKNGYESLDIIKEITDREELKEIGIILKGHQVKMMAEIKKLKQFDNEENDNFIPYNVGYNVDEINEKYMDIKDNINDNDKNKNIIIGNDIVMDHAINDIINNKDNHDTLQ